MFDQRKREENGGKRGDKKEEGGEEAGMNMIYQSGSRGFQWRFCLEVLVKNRVYVLLDVANQSHGEGNSLGLVRCWGRWG